MALMQSRGDRVSIPVSWELRDKIRMQQRPDEHFWQVIDRVVKAGLAAEAAKAKDKVAA
jgi:hypothetical protein